MKKIIDYFIIKKIKKQREQLKFNQIIWNAQKPLIEAQNKIDEEKKELTQERNQIKLPSWSKIFLAFLFINFTILEIFIGWVTIKSFSTALAIGVMPDFTPLITLVGAVIGQTLSYGFYSFKSKAENIQGGIIYETAMANSQPDTEEEGGVG